MPALSRPQHVIMAARELQARDQLQQQQAPDALTPLSTHTDLLELIITLAQELEETQRQ